jgi:hypothetical protein
MRMWKVPVKLLCKVHLLGEHVEMHMFAGTLSKGKSIKGYIDKGLIEVHNITSRHDDLAAEMVRRGMNHHSPIIEISDKVRIGKINVLKNIRDLCERCHNCRKRVFMFLEGHSTEEVDQNVERRKFKKIDGGARKK